MDSRFLKLMTEISKAFKQAGIKTISEAACGDGLAIHIEYDQEDFGLFVTPTNILIDAIEGHLCESQDTKN